jgi:DNA polymerase-1
MTKKILAIDTENTIYNKGNPFDARNINVCISFKSDDDEGILFHDKKSLEEKISKADLLVFFNAKYDLHWLRKLDIDIKNKPVWCCQLFEFIHNRMQNPYPSLDGVCEKYGLGSKIDVIEKEYWNNGINTDKIPREVLAEYALHDVRLTYELYKKQMSVMRTHQAKLMMISMSDLKVLAEMEWNGIHFDIEKAKEKEKEVDDKIKEIQDKLSIHHNIPNFNWNSNEHLSALLYGGDLTFTVKVPDGVYKSGQKKGQLKLKNEEVTYTLPRKFTPVKGSELKKPGFWSVDETYLLKLKGGDRELIDGILKIKELTKLKTTYYEGFRKLYEEMNWKDNLLHTTFTQVVARTGRLSSKSPNIQNLSDEAQQLITTRW